MFDSAPPPELDMFIIENVQRLLVEVCGLKSLTLSNSKVNVFITDKPLDANSKLVVIIHGVGNCRYVSFC